MWQHVETLRRQMRPNGWARRWRVGKVGMRRWVSVVVVPSRRNTTGRSRRESWFGFIESFADKKFPR